MNNATYSGVDCEEREKDDGVTGRLIDGRISFVIGDIDGEIGVENSADVVSGTGVVEEMVVVDGKVRSVKRCFVVNITSVESLSTDSLLVQ